MDISASQAAVAVCVAGLVPLGGLGVYGLIRIAKGEGRPLGEAFMRALGAPYRPTDGPRVVLPPERR